ncbi:MAG: TIGR00159 family protein [Gemmatimonadales bacterium]|nr:MAG: TIGR00159 family protein [Gemmatimonadales bacterium]
MLSALWEQFQFLRPRGADLFEIAIVGFLVYRLLLLLKRTRAMQMILGVGLLVGVYFLALLLQFELIRALLENLFQYGAIAMLVVFQPELRAALARLGQTRFFRSLVKIEGKQLVDQLVETVETLSRTRTGAIIALEREVGLDEYARTGSPLQAKVSAQLLTTIFTPYSPLHDGAVIISGDTIRAAGAILPLTQTPLADKSLGTRHRAAIGLSEETDAFVIVVSEETARISVARGGRIELGVDGDRLRSLLESARPDRNGKALRLVGG